jgi:hypothetical protein
MTLSDRVLAFPSRLILIELTDPCYEEKENLVARGVKSAVAGPVP